MGRPARPGPTPSPRVPSSIDKIKATEKTGKLDHVTALLYQVYAAYDPDSLPAEFKGDDSAAFFDCTTFFAEIRTRLGSMPAGIRTKMQPFFARPDQPQSIWSGSGFVRGDTYSSWARKYLS